MLLTSLNDRQMSLPDDLMSDDDVAQVGNYALAMCLSEYMDLHDKGVLTNEYSATCCNNHAMFDLPCRHLLLQRMKEDCCPLLSIDDIPQRWRRSIQIQERSPNTVKRVALTKNHTTRNGPILHVLLNLSAISITLVDRKKSEWS